ncbi:MAG: hypothetical protein RL477_2335 [Pseudomonadota bacterium]|jgi:hypothetical protein
MTQGLNYRDFLWAAAMVALVAAGALVWWWRDRPMPLDHLADVAAIAEKFEDVVFQSDLGKDFKGLYKWENKIALLVKDKIPHSLRVTLKTTSLSLATYSGLKIDLTDSPTQANVFLYFLGRDDFQNIATEFMKDKGGYDPKWTSAAMCYFLGVPSHWIYRRGLIVVGKSLPERDARSCLLEELYQSLGPGKDSPRLRYSISYSRDNLTELSLNDKLILRALYDDRLAPGMPRAEAMRVARRVIAELHAAVRARGPDALIHPRHAARLAAPGAAPAR